MKSDSTAMSPDAGHGNSMMASFFFVTSEGKRIQGAARVAFVKHRYNAYQSGSPKDLMKMRQA